MTPEETPRVARYQSLSDYLAVLRRFRVMIVIITLIGGAAGLANALRQQPVYQATAQVGFQDPTQDLTIAGLPGVTPESPAQLAEVYANDATSPGVIEQVRRQLGTPLSVQALSNAVSPQVNLDSSLLEITASASSASFAASLANGVANVLAADKNRQARAEFTQLANSVRHKLAQLKSGGAVQANYYEDELARLETLSAFATGAQTQPPAQPPSGPSSPKKGRDTALGLALGLLLGIIAAFVRDSMDRRLRRQDDFQEAFDLPVIGHVRKQSLGRVAYLGSNGNGLARPDLEAFRILRRNLEFLDHEQGITSVLITSAVAEEGKTTVATSLAMVMAAAGRRTLLVDCDLRRPDLAGRVGVEQTPGLSDYLSGHADPQEILRMVTFGERSNSGPGESTNGSGGVVHSLVCIPAGVATSRATELLGTSRFQEFLEQVAANYDVVVLDSSPLLPLADTREMLPHVDAVVVCARETQTTRDQARGVKAALARFPPRPTGIVATGVKPRGAEYEAYAYASAR